MHFFHLKRYKSNNSLTHNLPKREYFAPFGGGYSEIYFSIVSYLCINLTVFGDIGNIFLVYVYSNCRIIADTL